EDGIRDRNVTGVQTCALPICLRGRRACWPRRRRRRGGTRIDRQPVDLLQDAASAHVAGAGTIRVVRIEPVADRTGALPVLELLQHLRCIRRSPGLAWTEVLEDELPV